MKNLYRQRGMALAIAIFALVVIGGLVAGSMFVATQERRIGRNTLRQQTAFALAEAATQDVVLNWNTSAYNTLPLGRYLSSRGRAPGGRGWYERIVQRLGPNLFIVRSDGFSRDSTSRQRVGALLRLKPLAFNINAALKIGGSARLDGSAYISGADTPPAGWAGCPALAPTLPAIRIRDPGHISFSGCRNQSCLNGNPKILQDTTIDAGTLTTVGEIPFDSLKNYANKVVAGRNIGQAITSSYNVDGRCNTLDPHNWGDPLNPAGPCGTYYPIVWADGDASVTGVKGQGVLIVNGDLAVEGGFEFYGAVLVRGTLKTTGTGGRFNGGVVAANVDLRQNTVLGQAVINYSGCALARVLQRTASGSLVRERSWVNLYDND
jgi:hypothetical protein